MKLIIPKAVEERIHAYAMSVDSEIAGMGKVRMEGENIIVEEVMIYDQTVTGATADLSPKAMAQFQTELVRAGGSPKMWRLWFHSHDNMEAFFSGRDTATIDAHNDSDWLVSLVVNKRRERKCRLDVYKPFRMYMDEIEIEVDGQADYTVPADIKAEVELKVHKAVPSIGFGFGHSYKPVQDDNEAIIGLHRYCPAFTIGTDECYHPYGEKNTAVFANCTTKAFKKKYGANPFMPEVEPEGDYTKDQLVAICKTLEGQIAEYENRGQGSSSECLALETELVDMYYELAEVEVNEGVAEGVRAQARQLENTIYSLENADL